MKVAASTPAGRQRAASSSASSRRRSSVPKPNARASAISWRNTSRCAGERANVERATAVALHVDASLPTGVIGERSDLVHRAEQRALQRDRTVAAVQPGEAGQTDRQHARAPAAVAATGPEADVVALEHAHPRRRLGEHQRERGPQAGVAGADDHHVRVTQVVRLGVGRPGGRRRCLPQRSGRQAWHRLHRRLRYARSMRDGR